MKINRKKHRRFYVCVLLIIAFAVFTFNTMETYWTDTCNNPGCTVCNAQE